MNRVNKMLRGDVNLVIVYAQAKLLSETLMNGR